MVAFHQRDAAAAAELAAGEADPERSAAGPDPAAARPLCVLHVSQPTEYGVARCVADLAADQVSRGWAVGVACPSPSGLAGEVTAAGAVHHPWPAVRSPVGGLRREWKALASVIERAGPDVVHLHSSKAGLTGRALVRSGTPTLFQPHAWSFVALEGPMRTAAAGWERLAARWASRIICCSQDEARQGRDGGIHAEYEVVPNSVDLDHFAVAAPGERAEVRLRLGLPADAAITVCAGRLSRQKGQDLLLEAWTSVSAEVPGALLVLVGEGPDAAALAAAAPPGVRFVGLQRNMRDWLIAADVVALPSRYEGMAISVLEAMACACCIVAGAADGMREALGVEGTGAGVVVPVEDVPALAAAIVARLGDPVLAASEGRGARARAEANHDRRRWLQTMADLTRATAGAGAARRDIP